MNIVRSALVLATAWAMSSSALAQTNEGEWVWKADGRYSYDVWYDPGNWFVRPGEEIDRDRKDYDRAASQDPSREDYDPDRTYDEGEFEFRERRTFVPGDQMFDAVHRGTHYTWNDKRKCWDREDVSFFDQTHFYTVDFKGDKNFDDDHEHDAAAHQNEYLFHGTVADTKEVKISGGEDHMVAKLVADDGRTVVADLGTDLDPEVFSPAVGDEITVRGRKGTIDDKLVILTTQLSVDDEFMLARLPEDRGWFNVARPVTRMRSQTDWIDHDAWLVTTTNDEWLRDQEWLRSTTLRSNTDTAPETLTSFTGTVGEARRFSIAGGPDHTFVKINMPEGETRIIDLGPHLTLDQVKLTPGERVTVHAVRRDVGGSPVYVARHLNMDGMTLAVSEPAAEFLSQADPRGQTVVRGMVEDYRRINIHGGDEHTLLKIRRDDGQMAVIDLGPKFPMQELANFKSRGSDVVVRGQWIDVQGQPVLTAREMNVEGETIVLSTADGTR